MSRISAEDSSSSDEDVFIGPITLKEVRKMLFPKKHRHTVGCIQSTTNLNNDENDTSIKIIETHSAPNILMPNITDTSPSGKSTCISTSTALSSDPDSSPVPASNLDMEPDDSFLMLEQLVSSLSYTPQKKDIESCKKTQIVTQKDISYCASSLENSDMQEVYEIADENCTTTPIKNNCDTPYATPSNELKFKTPIFKTPGNPISHKKSLLTPSRKFQHIVSPVATYINKSPIVPLVKDVFPKKPIPGMSSIPKPLKHIPSQNKENETNHRAGHQTKIKLPSVAYRPAKETKMIVIPDEDKLPQSQWAQQLTSSIPRALVIKHSHREISSVTKVPQRKAAESSFANLSLHQADVSVCTQKSALLRK